MPVIVFLLICAEIAGLIKLGQVIGGGPVFGEILLSGVLGMIIIQTTGRTVLKNLALNVFMGRLSLRALLRRDLYLLLAGVLLLAPGLLTDAAGIVLVGRHLVARVHSPHRAEHDEEEAIDIEYRVHDEELRK